MCKASQGRLGTWKRWTPWRRCSFQLENERGIRPVRERHKYPQEAAFRPRTGTSSAPRGDTTGVLSSGRTVFPEVPHNSGSRAFRDNLVPRDRLCRSHSRALEASHLRQQHSAPAPPLATDSCQLGDMQRGPNPLHQGPYKRHAYWVAVSPLHGLGPPRRPRERGPPHQH